MRSAAAAVSERPLRTLLLASRSTTGARLLRNHVRWYWKHAVVPAAVQQSHASSHRHQSTAIHSHLYTSDPARRAERSSSVASRQRNVANESQSFDDAVHQLFNTQPPSILHADVVLSKIAASGNVQLWITTLQRVIDPKQLNLKLHRNTLNHSLHAFGRCNSKEGVQAVLHTMKHQRIYADVGTYNILLNIAKRAGDVQYGRELFAEVCQLAEQGHVRCTPNLITYTILIDLIANDINQVVKQALSKQSTASSDMSSTYQLLNDRLNTISEYYHQMLRAGIHPDLTLRTSIMKAVQAVDKFQPSLSAQHSISSQASTADTADDVFHINGLIEQAAHRGNVALAEKHYQRLLSLQLQPTVYTFELLQVAERVQWKQAHQSSSAGGNLSRAALQQVEHWLLQCQQYVLKPSADMYAIAIRSLASCVDTRSMDAEQAADKLKQLCWQLDKQQVTPTTTYYDSMLLFYTACAELLNVNPQLMPKRQRGYEWLSNRTQALLDEMQRSPTTQPTEHTYNVLLEFYTRMRLYDKAIAALQHMSDLSFTPTSIQLRRLLNALHESNKQCTSLTTEAATSIANAIPVVVDTLIGCGYEVLPSDVDALFTSFVTPKVRAMELVAAWKRLTQVHHIELSGTNYTKLLSVLRAHPDVAGDVIKQMTASEVVPESKVVRTQFHQYVQQHQWNELKQFVDGLADKREQFDLFDWLDHSLQYHTTKSNLVMMLDTLAHCYTRQLIDADQYHQLLCRATLSAMKPAPNDNGSESEVSPTVEVIISACGAAIQHLCRYGEWSLALELFSRVRSMTALHQSQQVKVLNQMLGIAQKAAGQWTPSKSQRMQEQLKRRGKCLKQMQSKLDAIILSKSRNMHLAA